MKCIRCGGAMMPETVIKLRRSLVGFRETRSQGAYCAACGIGWRVDAAPAVTPRLPAIFGRLRTGVREIWPAWRLSGMVRPGRVRAGGIAYNALPLAR